MAQGSSNTPGSTIQDDSQTFYPPDLWGLLPGFTCFRKMFVADVVAMNDYPTATGAYCYGNIPIVKVDIIGTIVRKLTFAKNIVYSVDDGTGVVDCCAWKSSYIDAFKNIPLEINETPSNLMSKVKELEEEKLTRVKGYEHGDLVKVKGRIRIFRNRREIQAVYMLKVTDPNEQTARIRELMALYRQVYDKPMRLPEMVQMEYEASADGNFEIKWTHELKDIIKDTIDSYSMSGFVTVGDLCQYSPVSDFINKHCPDQQRLHTRMLLNAIRQLENKGEVLKSGQSKDGNQVFELLHNDCRMRETIFRILDVETKKSKFQPLGCHYLHVVDELHRTVHYRSVTTLSVRFCLSRMEEDSLVIRSTNFHYTLMPT